MECSPIAAVARLNEQTLGDHAGKVATMNADVRQVFCSNFTLLQGEGDRAFSQGWLGTTRQSNRSARSRSRLRIRLEGSGVGLRGIGDSKFAVSFSPALGPAAEI
ncbi:hypothetical protein PMI41_02449 [Phyllobacterium sp. YR531]|nr:hypothetical protein PMI41_02449 [Phyllobacterium sp. YR531]